MLRDASELERAPLLPVEEVARGELWPRWKMGPWLILSVSQRP